MDRRGLTLEAAKILTRNDGAKTLSRTVGEVKITDVKLSAEAAKKINRHAGRFITLHGEPHAAGITALLRRAVLQLLPPRGKIFAVGLGNPDVTQDSLGALCVRTLKPCRGVRYSLAALETDVAAKTGIDTARLVRAAARELDADCVIAVDALCCENPRYIGKSVQISDAGIVPGSAGASSETDELCADTLGCPIVAVGVPTVCSLEALSGFSGNRDMLVSPADINIIIGMWAEVIGGAIDNIV